MLQGLTIPPFVRRRKLVLFTCAIVVPVVILAAFLVCQSLSVSRVLVRETMGTVYLRAVWAAIVQPDAPVTDRLRQIEPAALYYDEKLGLVQDRQALVQRISAHPDQVDDALTDYMRRVADVSGLTLDPKIDTYYLMNVAVTEIPQAHAATEMMGRHGGDAVAGAVLLRKAGKAVDDGIATAMHGSDDDALRTAITPALRTFDAQRAQFAGNAAAQGTDTGFRGAANALWQISVNQLDRLLARRLAWERMRLWWILAAAGTVTVMGLGAVFLIDMYVQREETLKLNASLMRSNEELERFAYICSHDMQEPVRMISLYAGLLEEDTQGQLDGIGQRHLSYIRDSAARLRDMIKGILDFSRVGREAIQTERVDSACIVNDVLADLAADIGARAAIIKTGDLPVVTTNPLLLRVVLQNLIGNALKFQNGVRRPEISVSSERIETGWRFSVTDNGIGIDEGLRAQVFVMFRRLNRKEDFAGTGIGLATCRKVIELCGGKIDFTSKSGQGSTFFFELPDPEGQGI